MSVIHAPKKPTLDGSILAFPIIIVPLMLMIFLRLWHLQVVEASSLSERATNSREVHVAKLAPRGLIYDRNGVLIAGVKPDLVVTAQPALLKKHPEVLPKLAAILGMSEAKIEEKLKDSAWRPYIPTPIKTGVSIRTAALVAESLDELPMVGIENKPMRDIRDPFSFSHVLGYVWVPNDKDTKRLEEQNIEPAEYVGKTGVERAYESQLMGTPGAEIVEVDAKRRPKRVLGREAAIAGKQLKTTLDARLQQRLTQYMKERQLRGAVVAIDPTNGEVLCLVSSPTFDQRLFEGGISTDDWNLLNTDESRPMNNRAIAGIASPGSTFKIVTALAAYREGRLTRNTTAVCNGGYTLGRRTLKCLGHHGGIGFVSAMQKSCNTYFCTLGMRAGPDAICQAALDLGLGDRSGIEIVGESKAVVPSKQWLASRNKPLPWYGGDTLNLSIGQGYISATPLQMANLAAMVSMRGVRYRPHLVHSMIDPATGVEERIQPEKVQEIRAENWFWEMLTDGLTAVIEGGTASVCQLPGVRWAGKTGSTEYGRKTGKTHSWFVGFAPRENPRIAICAFAEAAGHGGEVSAPLAKEAVSFYLSNLAKASSKPARASVAN